eukprot:scaffold11639_cov172-Amphora_coffeaeformis.AAC.13
MRKEAIQMMIMTMTTSYKAKCVTYCLAVAIKSRRDLAVRMAQRIMRKIPAPNPASFTANGIPTIPDPTIALTRFAVHPNIELLCSWTSSFCRTGLRVPPGVCWTTVTLGVLGLKNGLDGAVRGLSTSSSLAKDRDLLAFVGMNGRMEVRSPYPTKVSSYCAVVLIASDVVVVLRLCAIYGWWQLQLKLEV